MLLARKYEVHSETTRLDVSVHGQGRAKKGIGDPGISGFTAGLGCGSPFGEARC